MTPDDAVAPGAPELARALSRRGRWFVLTGAGCSTESGIPAYRDESGAFVHASPMTYRDFTSSEARRRRYWSRSVVGYQRIEQARPNAAHRALARLEALGRLSVLVTQNVDGLHRDAGSRNVIELHGRLSEVECLGCGNLQPRSELQRQLCLGDAPRGAAGVAPDGDALVDRELEASISIPSCQKCGGILKPGVVFFGETVPAERVGRAYRELSSSDGVLVVGSSLMVMSGFRFVRRAVTLKLPVVVVNTGRTRADELALLKVEEACGPVLEHAVATLASVA